MHGPLSARTRLAPPPGRPPVAAALDLPTLASARALAEAVAPHVGMLKVGLELFVEHGPEAVAVGEALGLPVFLDLKLHDIPATVGRATARAAGLGARVLTVHAGGGRAMLEAAVRSAEGTELVVCAVTVLTSLDANDLAALGVAGAPAAHAVRLAHLAWASGVRAFVCSPAEAGALRAALGPEALLVTPGVRSGAARAGSDDQKRVATAAEARAAGADWLVVGRPLRDAADPRAAARALAEELRP